MQRADGDPEREARWCTDSIEDAQGYLLVTLEPEMGSW